MAKKKNKSKAVSFKKMLKENQKKIFILNNEENVSLKEMTDLSDKHIKAGPMEVIVPVSSIEATKKKTSASLNIDVRYAKPAFTLYEYAMKYYKTPQTLVITVNSDEGIDNLFEYGEDETMTTLMDRTNISLILKKMERPKTKLGNWLKTAPEKDYEIFLINIPDVVLFTGVIGTKEPSDHVCFDLMIQVVKTKKASLTKIKKKFPELFDSISEHIIEDTLLNATNLGHAAIHNSISKEFLTDESKYAKDWHKSIYDENNVYSKTFNEISFTLNNSDDYIIFARTIEDLSSK